MNIEYTLIISPSINFNILLHVDECVFEKKDKMEKGEMAVSPRAGKLEASASFRKPGEI